MFVSCCIVIGIPFVYVYEPVWSFLYGFFYGVHLEAPYLDQIGAMGMGVVFADTLAFPAVVVWLVAAYMIFLVLSSKREMTNEQG